MPRSLHRSLLVAVVFGVLPGCLAGQSDAPPVRRAREIVSLVNSGTPATIRAYVDSAFAAQMRGMPLTAHLNFFFGQRAQWEGLDWVGPTTTSADAATVTLTRRLTGEQFGLAVQVETTPPYKIASLRARPPAPGSTPPLTVASDADMAAQVEQFVGKLAAADVFSGAVLLAHNGRVLFSKAYGTANKDFEVPNRLDTRFNLGSMNKMFTAVAIAQLAEQGKLSFDDPLSRFLPDFPSPEAAKKIRIKHLLSHTAGLGSYFNAEFDRSSRARFRTVDEMMVLARGDSMAFEPGTRWSYSNTGILVLGKVIEVASGQDYFSYIREHIYRPAGMTRSDSYDLDYVNTNLAVGYEKEYGEDGGVRYHNNIFQHVIRGGPAGGGYSTVEDLQRFANALMAGKLVGAALVEQLTTAKPDLTSPAYGYGFGVNTANGIVGHSGGFPGISSNLDIFTRSGYVAVVQANYGGASSPVTERIRALVRARTGPTP